MKCTNCRLPLSPNNTPIICPRCHTTTQSGPKSTLPRTSQSFDNQGWNGQGGQAGVPASPRGQEQPTSYYQEGTLTQVQPPSSPLWNTNPQHDQLPFPQPGQMWQSTPPPTPIATPISSRAGGADVLQTNSNAYMSAPQSTRAMYPPPTPLVRPQTPRRSNFGFFVAALFVITGGLMLVVVYIMALGLPQTDATSASLNTPQSTQSILSSPTTAKTTIVNPTPTSTLPGQSYIDNAQMASAVNINTAQPLQTTTTFQENKKIYVTFAIHPNGKSGAVCLYWYLNNHNITQYPFAVTDTAKAGYSFAVYGGTGAAYVDIYWASTITCSDKILAQHVTFTVKA